MRRALLGAALSLALLVPAAAQAVGPPVIKSTFFSHVTSTSATLEAEVDPNGRATRYHFEYGSADCATGPCTSVPEGPTEPQIPPTIKLTGTLANGNKTVTGVHLIAGAFGSGDLIEGPGITPGTEVESYDSTKSILQLTQEAFLTLSPATLTATGPQRVSFALEGLAPVTTHHFRLVAIHKGEEGGEVTGPDTTFITYPEAQPFAPCPNDAFRTDQPSATLPDCRAYEQASPVDKSGQDARGTTELVRASVDGDAVSFVTSTGIPGGEGGQDLPTYLARRDPLGWSTLGLLPNQSAGSQSRILGWTPSFDHVFESAWTPGESSELGEYLLTTLLSRSSVDGSQQTIVPPTAIPALASSLKFAATSDDGSYVLFESRLALPSVPGAIEGKPNLYLWDAATDTATLAGVLNDQAPPAQGALAGSYNWAAGTSSGTLGGGGADVELQYYTQDNHVLSADGRSLYFTAAGTGKLYLRRNPAQPQSLLDQDGDCTEPAKACTVEISASQRTPADPAGTQPAAFVSATADGSNAFFMSSEELTNNANTGPPITLPPPPSIGRSDLYGKQVEPDFIPKTNASALAVNSTHIYWVDPDNNSIGRADLNGEHLEPMFVTGANNPQGVAVDSTHLYWTNPGEGVRGAGTIGRATLDGSGNLVPGSVNQSFIAGANDPRGIAVDSAHIYWANHGPDGLILHFETGEYLGGELLGFHAIGRADLDGNNSDQAFFQFEYDHNPVNIAVNDDYLFTTESNGQIHRIAMVGDPIDNNARDRSFSALQTNENVEIRAITLDPGHIYWADRDHGRIDRSTFESFEYKNGREPNFIGGIQSPEGLTSDSSHFYWSSRPTIPRHPGNDLYRFESSASGPSWLTDLTPDSADENGAEVRGVLGTSTDGSHVYFAANGVLAPGAEPGDCHGVIDEETGTCNLYLSQPDPTNLTRLQTIFVTRLSGADHDDWRPNAAKAGSGITALRTARVSPDGRTLLFASTRQLTPYDNHGLTELYRYRLGQSGLDCVSCSPSGAPPSGAVRPQSQLKLSFLFPPSPIPVLTRNLSASGDQVFFSTVDSLLPEDTNGGNGCPAVGPVQIASKYPSCLDVYEWEADGAGSCESDFENGGCLYLLSPPNSSGASFFGDASASGDDVFIFTRSQLVGQDQDQLLDVYDARVGGGLAAQNEPSLPVCEADGCKPSPDSPPPPLPCGSACLSGPGNPKPACPKGKVRKGGKCVKKTHKKRVRRQRSHKHGGRR